MKHKELNIESIKPAETRALDSPEPVSDIKPKDHALLARLIVREGKPFYHSALQAGYSESIAARGLKNLLSQSKPVSDAIRKESDMFHVQVDKLRPLAINRLYFELIDANSSNGMKAVELAGRLKELDMFVRGNDTNIGILIGVQDSTPDTDKPIDVFKE